MKKLFLILSFLTVTTLFSQEIDFKKGIVYIDGKECLKYESEGNNTTLKNLNGDDIVTIQYLRPDGSQQSLYNKIIFLEYNKSFTSKNYIYTRKALVEKLLKSNVLVECAINSDKIDTFILKYDEKVEDRMNNTNTNTIIIKEEPRRSGININIGR
jgi:hypothetical protein